MLADLKKHLPFELNRFTIFLILIILLGSIFRFVLLQNFVLGNDNARDVLISQVLVEKRELPLIGPFSSAGPFVTGPVYYWVLMAGNIFFPFGLSSLWVAFLCISILTIIVFIYVGYLLGGKRLAIILGLLSATSYELVSLSLNVANPTLVIIFTTLLIASFILFVQKKKIIYAFLSGLLLGIALNMHYQAINLLLFAPAILLIRGITWKSKLLACVVFGGGFVLALLPLVWWDAKQGFSNINNILDYFLIVQYRTHVPNSWSIFIVQDMSKFWGATVGGNKMFGFLGMALVGVSGLLSIVKAKQIKIGQEYYLLAGIFCIMLLLNRFYHGQRSEVYLLYFLPFILLFIGLSFEILLKYFTKNTIITYLLYLVIAAFCIGNLLAVKVFLQEQKSNIPDYQNAISVLIEKYPNTKFSLYDREGRSKFISLPLSVVMSDMQLQSNSGRKIAVDCIPSKECAFGSIPVATVSSGFPIIDISTMSARTIDNNFVRVNKNDVYEDLIGWSKKHELLHTFNLLNFIKEKLGQ